VEGVVEIMLDATQSYDQPLTDERLFGWHAALFPTGRSGMQRITVGGWRDDKTGPMQAISGPYGRERVHYEAPGAERMEQEMDAFLAWFNRESGLDPVLKAAVAHRWFVTVHPFHGRNGRIARAIADMALARSESSTQRFYSMAAQIQQERKSYYDILEETQRNDLDITQWFSWFLGYLGRAFGGAETVLAGVLRKARFWEKHAGAVFNERQRDMLGRLLDGFDGKMTSSKRAKIEKCSPNTALRDISDLIERGILKKDAGGGRSTSYSLAEVA
jgi:Fic family protein